MGWEVGGLEGGGSEGGGSGGEMVALPGLGPAAYFVSLGVCTHGWKNRSVLSQHVVRFGVGAAANAGAGAGAAATAATSAASDFASAAVLLVPLVLLLALAVLVLVLVVVVLVLLQQLVAMVAICCLTRDRFCFFSEHSMTRVGSRALLIVSGPVGVRTLAATLL